MLNEIILDILLGDHIQPINVNDVSGNEIIQVLNEIINEIVNNHTMKIEMENHRTNFQCALGALKKYQPFALKKVENNPYNDIPGGYGKNIQSIKNFYSEGFKIYTWQKKWKGDIFIYGNPFSSGCF